MTTRAKHVYRLDNGSAEIEWTLNDGNFSMSAGIWNARHTDFEMCGQCVDTVAAYFPNDEKAQEMLSVWERWHLNDMRAGTPAQTAILRSHKDEFPGYPTSYYDFACHLLEANGLLVDNGYKYGSAWLREELPTEVVAIIEGWDR